MTERDARRSAESRPARDPAFIRRAVPLLWPLVDRWFRPDIRGLGHIPSHGPVLLVGNHSGGNVAPDTVALTLAFVRHFGADRPFFQLAHDLVAGAPPLAWLHRFGTVAASWPNAERALDSGAAVLVYPGGDLEAHRPSWQGNRVDFHDRRSFIRLALAQRVPIVPVVAVGGQETALFLGQGEWLAHLAHLDSLLQLHVVPVSVALPWGLDVGDTFGHIPLPAKLTIEVLEPIDLAARYGEAPDVGRIYRDIVELMQQRLDRLAAERRWPVLG